MAQIRFLCWPLEEKRKGRKSHKWLSSPNTSTGHFVSESYCSFSIWLHSVALHNESQAWSSASVSVHLWANLRFYTTALKEVRVRVTLWKCALIVTRWTFLSVLAPGQLAQRSISNIVYAINLVHLIDCKVSASTCCMTVSHCSNTVIVSETWASLSFTLCHDFNRLS